MVRFKKNVYCFFYYDVIIQPMYQFNKFGIVEKVLQSINFFKKIFVQIFEENMKKNEDEKSNFL